MNANLAMQSVDLAQYRKIALIADTHGPVHDLLIDKLSRHDCIVHAGDIGGLERLGVEEIPLFAVLGNNDTQQKWPENEKSALANLPEILSLALPGGRLVVIHGHQYPVVKSRHEKLRRQFPDAKAILYGHSHQAVVDKSSRPWIVNPGAAGRVRAYGSAGFMSLSVSKRRWLVNRISID